MDFEGKHVFFISDCDRFFFLFGDALITKLDLPAERIVPVVFKSGMKPIGSPRLTDVSYINYEDIGVESLSVAKSLTFMSLNRWNSSIVKRLIDTHDEFLEKIHIFITDDEVDRWKKNYADNGQLLEDPSLHISDDCIYVISRVKFFIAPKPYFHKKISEVANRNDIEFVNASIVFDILPHHSSELMRQTLCEIVEYGGGGYRVLVGTKWYNRKALLRFLRNPVFSKHPSNFQFFCFINPKHRFILEAFMMIRKFFGGDILNVTYLTPVSPQMYTSLLASCTHLLLQDRGGASTARLFAKWGCGRIAVRRNSPNHIFLEECYGVDLYVYDREYQINADFFEGGGFDPLDSKRNVCAEEERSLGILSNVYT